MHLKQCLNPVRIFNKYADEFQYVPCGKCEACRNAHSSYWVQRLREERKAWKYCLFVTLTYSEQSLPRLKFSRDLRVASIVDSNSFDGDLPLFEFRDDLDLMYSNGAISDFDYYRNVSWIEKNGAVGIGHLSVRHVQLFIKRLRKNLKNRIKNENKEFKNSDYLVRYAICGEYGETTYRPHYHCLFFFSSEKESKVIEDVIRQSWTLGIVDTSFVAGENSSYVASYLNSYSNLPKIYQYREIRPFLLCSKCPPIGTLSYNDEEVRELFDSCSPTQAIYDTGKRTVVDVPLWRCYKNRLFPRLPFFDKFSHFDRTLLYRAFENVSEDLGNIDPVIFKNYILYRYNVGGFSRSFLHVYKDYLDIANKFRKEGSNIQDFVIRWAYVSSRVVFQSMIFGVTVDEYVSHIEKFYDNCEKENLKSYFRFQSDYTEDYDCKSLVGLDALYLDNLMHTSLVDVSDADKLTLESFGIDLGLFFNENDSVRLEYQYSILPESQRDYQCWYGDSISRYRKMTKNKKKNDYLKMQDNPVLYNLSDF